MEQPTLTLEQALSILDQAAACAPLQRQEHVAVQLAVQIIADALKPQPAGDAESA